MTNPNADKSVEDAFLWYENDKFYALVKDFQGYYTKSGENHIAIFESPYKQMIERLNRTYKASYRPTNGFDNYDGANYDLALWVAYYNFLRPHQHNKYQVLNKIEMLENADNMPAKWQLLIFLGQQTILNLQASGCS